MFNFIFMYQYGIGNSMVIDIDLKLADRGVETTSGFTIKIFTVPAAEFAVYGVDGVICRQPLVM